MKEYQKYIYINALRKCAKEHENDTTYTGNIVVSDICSDTADLLEELEQEQEPIIDKIKSEIIELYCDRPAVYDHPQRTELYNEVMKIINKYKTEGEGEHANKEKSIILEEIEKQEKWLSQAGYNAYNVNIALNTIKHMIKSKEQAKSNLNRKFGVTDYSEG